MRRYVRRRALFSFSQKGEGGFKIEKDISAQEAAAQARAWLPQKDENKKRKKDYCLKKGKRQGKAYALMSVGAL